MTDHNYLIEKIKQFCDYQERCISDVKNKLSEWNVQPAKIEKIILELQKTDFINEERYAKAYASGKFRIKKWGKNKIISEMNKKQIPDIYIQIGLHEIDDEEYLNTLKEIISKKDAIIKISNPEKRKQKLAAYAISKGYSRGIVWKVLSQTI
ncbi:MAG: RecX family transcriptional regulator [Bacteroidales bacterium]|nr:RecX family transcriptional regulator [Bacteroidales bacterium]